MNILEQYIEEIHSVEPFEADWAKKYNKEFVRVDITTNCYGVKDRVQRVFDTVEWEQIKEQGYYMG